MKLKSVIFILLFCANTSFSQEQPKLATSSQEQPAKEKNAVQTSTEAKQELAPYGKSTPSTTKSEVEKVEKASVLAPMDKKD